MNIIGLDPGNEKSAYVVYEDGGKVLSHGIVTNKILLNRITTSDPNGSMFFEPFGIDEMVIEMVASYGMAVGKTVFETCVWIGRFIQAWQPKQATKVYRKDVKMHLCNSMRAKDGNIRQALLDRYPATGGGKCPQIGIKSKPGPLYSVSKDVWSALAVAVYWDDVINKET